MPALGPTTYNQFTTGVSTPAGTLPIPLYLKSLADLFITEVDSVEDWIPRAFKVSNTDMIQETSQGFAGLTDFHDWDGESGQRLQNIDMMYATTLVQKFWRDGIAFSWKFMKFLQYREVMADMVSSLAKQAQITRQKFAFSYLNEGFTTVWNATDNVYFFSAAHKLLNGLTCSNLTTGALSVTSLQTAVNLLENTKDDRGNKMNYKAAELWVPTDMQFIADEVLGHAGWRPDTGNNTPNALAKKGIKPVVCPWLDDSHAWFVKAADTKTICKVSQPLEQTMYKDNNLKSTIHDAIFGFQVGAKDWRGWVGSTGV
jgi:hypothetical protein